jgi:GNAT superfamily N-acetyltransferase
LYDSAVTRDYSLIVDDEYRIRVDGQIQALETRLGKINNYSELITVGVKLLDVDLAKSTAYRINLTGEDQRYFINLKLFKIYNKKDGSSANYLYIADRYVRPDLRGKKIGEQLLGIADSVARANDCSLVFGKLIAEEPAETELLKQGHAKVGYTIDERKDGEIIASKEINEK